MARSFGCAWFVWLPSFLFTVTYCFVYCELRYLAAPYALMYFGLIAAMWNVRLPRPVVIFSLFAVPALSLLLFGSSFRGMVRQFLADVTGTNSPIAYFNVEIAEAMQRHGLQPGDRVVTIGFSLAAAHVGLEQAQIVALVPERIRQDDNRSGRPMVFSFENSDNFWRSSPQVKQRVFAAFQSTGAKWVFADCIPEWADRTGWESAGGAQILRDGDLPFEFFKKL